MNRVTKMTSVLGLARDLVLYRAHDIATHISEDVKYEIPCKSNSREDLETAMGYMSDAQLEAFRCEINDLYTGEE